MPNIQKPTGVNVGVFNPGNAVYFPGSERADGSRRILFADGVLKVQERTNGFWSNTGLLLSGDTLFLDNDVKIGTVGSHLRITSEENGRDSILLESHFDDAGSGLPHTHTLGQRFNHVVFVPNESGEIITKKFELPVTSFLTAFRYTYYFKSGSVPAIEPVTMTLSKGSTPGGTVVHQVTVAPEVWGLNVEAPISLKGGLQLSIGAPLLLTIESDELISIVGDGTVTGTFFAMDFQMFALEDVIAIPTGTDRFTFGLDGSMSIGNDGNSTMAGEQGSLDTTTPITFPPLDDPPPPGV